MSRAAKMGIGSRQMSRRLGRRLLRLLLVGGVALVTGLAPGAAKPLLLTWYDPLLRFEKGEEVVYEVREARRVGGRPRPQPQVDLGEQDEKMPRMFMMDEDAFDTDGAVQWITHSKSTVTFVILTVNAEKRTYTVGPVNPKEYGKIKLHAQTVFDMVGQMLPGGPVPLFEPHKKKRGLMMSPPPPPEPPAPLLISDKGELIEREKIQGKPGPLIGEVRFEAQVAGELIYELEPCVWLTGTIVRIQNNAVSSVEWVDLVYSPDRGCVREATFDKGYQRTSYYYLSSKPAPVRSDLGGVTPWFPPLPERVRLLLSPDAADSAPARPDTAALNALRGAVLVEPGWYQGVLPALRQREMSQAAGRTSALERFRRTFEEWDFGLTSSVGVTLLPRGAEEVHRVLGAWQTQRPASISRWASVGRWMLSSPMLAPEDDVRLSVDPEGQEVWLERGGKAEALRSRWPPLSPKVQLVGFNAFARWTTVSSGMPQPAFTIEAVPFDPSLETLYLTLKPGSPSNQLLLEGTDGQRMFVLGVHSVSPGSCHLLLSAWDPASRGWLFQDRWVGGVSIEAGANRQTIVKAVLDHSKSTLVMWMSCGLLICVDARSGDLLWSRTWTPENAEGADVLAASEEVVGIWKAETRRFTAFDRQTGARLWERAFPAGTRWWGLNALAAHVGTDRACEGLDPKSGVSRWRAKVPEAAGTVSGRGAVQDQALVVPFERSVMVFDSFTGASVNAVTRPEGGPCHILTASNDPEGWWLLTADRLERYLPDPR